MRMPLLSMMLLAMLAPAVHAQTASERKSRTFDFEYHATITPPANAQLRVWVPVPSTTPDQTVEILSAPQAIRMTTESNYHNRLAYLEQRNTTATPVHLDFSYRVTRYEDRGQSKLPDAERDTARYLKPDALVPVGGKSVALIKDKSLPSDQLQLARELYDIVDDHMQYRKDKPGWGTGNADWAVESCFGNCTDFHSLFISLSRSQHIPAKFEIGFMLGTAASDKVAGYHCWAKFQPDGKGWIPVDISDANQHPEKRDTNFGTLDANRVLFSTGRDLTLEPRQGGEPVNFLVYPYVEVDGKPLKQDEIEKHFAYKNVAKDTSTAREANSTKSDVAPAASAH
jgi:hypothetical protein